MTRESVDVKGRRYLTEGRLRVRSVRPGVVVAECRGSDRTYQVGWSRGGWLCDCPARSRCAHLVALQLVVEAPTSGGTTP